MYNRSVTAILVLIFKVLRWFRGGGDRPVPDPAKVRRLLLISTTGLGDTVMATASFRAARTLWPHAEIKALVHVRWLDLFEAYPHLDGIIPYPGKFKQLGRVMSELKAFRPDLAVTVHANDPDIVPLAYLSGAGCIVGWAGSRFGFLMDKRVPRKGGRQHILERYLDCVRAAGGDIEAPKEEVVLPEKRLRWAEEFWCDAGLSPDDKLVILNPGGSHQSKRWPEEYWRELIKKLRETPGVRVALFGSKAERPMMEQLAQPGKGSDVLVVSRPKVVEAAALLPRANALVGPDSGLAHVAYGLDVPAVVFFGPDDPELSGPYKNKAPATVLVADKSVCPEVPGCRKKECRPNRCLLAITPDMVLSALEGILNISLSFDAKME